MFSLLLFEERKREFWPIALENRIVKLFAKVLANRLEGVMNIMVSKFQFTFRKGRNVADCFIDATEVVNWCVRGRHHISMIKLRL